LFRLSSCYYNSLNIEPVFEPSHRYCGCRLHFCTSPTLAADIPNLATVRINTGASRPNRICLDLALNIYASVILSSRGCETWLTRSSPAYSCCHSRISFNGPGMTESGVLSGVSYVRNCVALYRTWCCTFGKI
jgi:hypothetical protein